MVTATWTAAAASERGSAHTEGVGNQDAVGSRTLTVGAAASPVLLVAVSDGHGGRRYVRSQAGSRFAVAAGLDALENAVRNCDVLGEHDASAAARRGKLDVALRAAAADATQRWRAAVLAHLATTPFTEAERISAGDSLDRDPLTAYGSTLLFCLASGDWLGFAQLGDGDVVVRTRGTSRSPVPGDDRLVAGATTSLCLPDPVSDFRYAVLAPDDDIDLVLLATDGYGNAFASDK